MKQWLVGDGDYREFDFINFLRWPGGRQGHFCTNEVLDEKLAARFPIKDDSPLDLMWGNLRRRYGSSTKP